MRFWLSGLMEAEQGNAYRHARNAMQAQPNALPKPISPGRRSRN
jgi:hypothetical protein